MTSIETILLGGNEITELSPLSGLTTLRKLHVGGGGIDDQDFRQLAGLSGLENLVIHNTQISDLDPLANLTEITWLSMSGNRIYNISSLSGLTQLKYLRLEQNQVIELSPLVDNPGIGEDDDVWIHENPIDCIEQASNIWILKNRGVNLRTDCI